MPELIITRGLPGSGKTTWAEQWVRESPANRARVNRDSFRAMMHAGTGQNQATESAITKAQTDLARTLLRDGWDVVVDDTNLRQRTARHWATLADMVGVGLSVQDFTTVPLGDCLARNAARPTPIPEHVIRTMHLKYVKPGALPHPKADARPENTWVPYVKDETLPAAYIFDLDGTLAIKGDRDIYDGSKAHLDTVNSDVAKVLEALPDLGAEIIFMSGRSEDHREVTATWLINHGLAGRDYMKLHMRPAGDKRRDDLVKHELFNTHIRGKYNILGIFDDRDQVVRLWRDMGITCFQVADGNF